LGLNLLKKKCSTDKNSVLDFGLKNPQTNNVVDYTPMIVPTNMFLIGPVVSKKKTKM
jgi:hypothetical protein